MIVSASSLPISKVVNFQTHAAVGGTTSFTGYTVVGHVSGRFLPGTSNASVNHDNIWPSLDSQTKTEIGADDYREYDYVLLDKNGTQVYIGLPWIVPASLEAAQAYECHIVLSSFTPADEERVRQILRLNNQEVKTLTVQSVT